MDKFQKCAVIGCGAVGAAVSFTLMSSGLFSELVLIDLDEQRAQGEAMDLEHGLPFVGPMKLYAGNYSDLPGCGLIIITAGAAQKPGEDRLSLAQRNVDIYKSIIPQITQNNREAMLLVVSNPVDVLTYAALKLSGLPEKRVIGSGTVLDTARLKYMIGRELFIDSRNVHAFMIGEHGDSEVAVFSSANISGIDLDAFCTLSGRENGVQSLKGVYEAVRDSAYHIIDKKGATNWAIALSVLRIAKCILRDERSVLTVSSAVGGSYGLPDIALSLPVILGKDGVVRHIELPLNTMEEKRLRDSARMVDETILNIKW